MKPSRSLLLLFGLSCGSSLFAGGGEELIAPIVVSGVEGAGHFQTTFRFLSLAGTTVEAEVSAYPEDPASGAILFCDPGGSPPLPRATTQRSFTLAGYGVQNISSSGTSIPVFDGWARVSLDREGVAQASVEVSLIDAAPADCPPPGINICSRPSFQVITSVQIPAVKPALRFRSQAIVTTVRHTAFAIVNPSETETAKVEMRLLDDSGETHIVMNPLAQAETKRTFELGPRQSVREFVWDLIDPRLPVCWLCPVPPLPVPPPQMFHGSVSVSSDIPVAVAGLHVLLPEGKLVNVLLEAPP